VAFRNKNRTSLLGITFGNNEVFICQTQEHEKLKNQKQIFLKENKEKS
jgi:hypothetical protein